MPTIIKAGETGPLLKRLTAVDLADHLAEADAIVRSAKRQVERLLAEARREAERLRAQTAESAYKAGFDKGRAEGVRRGREAAYKDAMQRFNGEQAHIVADMQRAIAQIDTLKNELRVSAEAHLLDFAVRLASKLTVAIGRVHGDAVVENLQRALRLVGSKTDLSVRAHPDDIASLEQFASSVLCCAEGATGIEIIADASVLPGGCLVETQRSRVDATLETQLDEMVALLVRGDSNREP